MKQLIFLSIICSSLQFSSCTSTQKVAYTPQYPRGAELSNGHYGERVYAASTRVQQDGYAKYYAYCDTAEKIIPRESFTRVQILAVATAEVCEMQPVVASTEEKLSVLALATTSAAIAAK